MNSRKIRIFIKNEKDEKVLNKQKKMQIIRVGCLPGEKLFAAAVCRTA